jgi:hypothetical protein
MLLEQGPRSPGGWQAPACGREIKRAIYNLNALINGKLLAGINQMIALYKWTLRYLLILSPSNGDLRY